MLPSDQHQHTEGPEYKRGLFAEGPQFVTFSDVLRKAQEQVRGDKTRDQFGFSSPDELYKAEKLTRGRRLFSAKEAAKQRAALSAA